LEHLYLSGVDVRCPETLSRANDILTAFIHSWQISYNWVSWYQRWLMSCACCITLPNQTIFLLKINFYRINFHYLNLNWWYTFTAKPNSLCPIRWTDVTKCSKQYSKLKHGGNKNKASVSINW